MNNQMTFSGKTEAEIISRNWKRNDALRVCFSDVASDELRRNFFANVAKTTRSPSLKAYALSKAQSNS